VAEAAPRPRALSPDSDAVAQRTRAAVAVGRLQGRRRARRGRGGTRVGVHGRSRRGGGSESGRASSHSAQAASLPTRVLRACRSRPRCFVLRRKRPPGGRRPRTYESRPAGRERAPLAIAGRRGARSLDAADRGQEQQDRHPRRGACSRCGTRRGRDKEGSAFPHRAETSCGRSRSARARADQDSRDSVSASRSRANASRSGYETSGASEEAPGARHRDSGSRYVHAPGHNGGRKKRPEASAALEHAGRRSQIVLNCSNGCRQLEQ
jgi:hypothetical protein